MEDKNRKDTAVIFPSSGGQQVPSYSPIAPEVPGNNPQSLSLNDPVISADSGNNNPLELPPVQPKQKNTFLRLAKRADVILALLLMLGSIGLAFGLRSAGDGKTSGDISNEFGAVELPLIDFTGTGGLSFGSQVVTINGALVVAPSLQPTAAEAGQIYYDQTTNVLAYFNGTEFVPLTGAGESTTESATTVNVQSIGGLTGQIAVGPGLSTAGGLLTNTGVISVQGQTGAVTFTAGNGIGINGTTISNTGVISVTSSSPSLIVADDGNGNITLSGSSGGTVSSSGGTTGHIPVFTSSQNIEDSIITQSGLTITVTGDLAVVTGGLSLSNALTVSNGGTGATSLAANGVLVGNGTGPITSVVSSVPNQCLVSTAGAPIFTTCPSAAGVATLNGLSGAINIANASGSGSTITIDNASTSAKGIAQFNATNFTDNGAGVINTIQNINTGATPTFAGVNTNAITPSGALTVGATGQQLTLQGNANTTITATGGGFATTVGFTGTPTGAVSYNFDRAAAAGEYNICTTVGNCSGLDGAVSTSGGTAGTIAMFTGLQNIENSIITQSGSVIDIAGSLALSNALGVAYGGTGLSTTPSNGQLLIGNGTGYSLATLTNNGGLTITNGAGSIGLAVNYGSSANTAVEGNTQITVAAGSNLTGGGSLTLGNGGSLTINVADSPTFAGNIVVQGGNITAGTTTQSGSLILHDGNGQTTTIQAGNSTTDLSFILPVNAGSATQCLKQSGIGNQLVWDDCEGGSGGLSGVTSLNALVGALTIQGTANRIIVSDNGTNTITVSTPQDIHTAANPQFANLTLTGDLAVNGGDITSTGALNITPGGAMAVGAASQTLTLQGNASTSLAATNGGNTTSLVFATPTGNNTITLPNASGVVCLNTGNCVGVGGGVTTPGGTAGTIALFTDTQEIDDSIITQTGTTINIAGSLSLSNALDVASGGTGINTTPSNGQLLIGNGTGTGYSLATLTNNGGLTITNGAGSIGLAVNYGSSAGTAVQGNTTLTCAAGTGNLTGGGNSITLGSGGSCDSLNTINDPTFSDSVTTPLIQGAGLTVASTGANDLQLQTNGNTRLTVSSGGDITATGNMALNGGTLSVGATTQPASLTLHDGTGQTTTLQAGDSSSDLTFVLPTGPGSGFQCLKKGTGNQLIWDDCEGGGSGTSGVTSLNTFTGDLVIQGTANQIVVSDNGSDTLTLSLGSAVTLQGNTFNGANQLVQLNGSSQLPAVSGALLTNLNGSAISSGTVANTYLVNGGALTVSAGTNLTGGGSVALGGSVTLDVASSPTFAGNVTVQGGTLTVGTASQLSSLILHDGTGFTGTLTVAGLSANRTYTLPNEDGVICLDTGNCAGSGSGVTTPGGTPGTIAMFTDTQEISDSLLSQSGGTVTVAGNLNLSSGSQYQINGTQISSGNLSDGGNLAKLNASQTFTGNNNTFRNGTNSADGFSIQRADGLALLTADTTAGQIVMGVGSELDGKLVFNNASNNFSVTLVSDALTASRTVQLPDADGIICLDTGNCAGAGATLQTAYNFSTGGTTPKIKVNDTLLGLEIQDADTSIEDYLFTVRASESTGLGLVMFGVDSSGQTTIQSSANSTTALRLLTQGGTSVLTGDTQNGRIILGQGGTLTGTLQFSNSSNSNLITLTSAAASSAQTITLPNASGTVCLTSGNCMGSGGVGDVLQNGNSFGTAMTLGTNDAFSLNLETSGVTRLTIAANGSAVTLANNTDLILQGETAYISNPQTSSQGESFGSGALVSGNRALAVGNAAAASGFGSIALGRGAEAGDEAAIAIGTDSFADHNSSIALGYGATTTADHQLVIGGSTDTYINHVIVGSGVTDDAPMGFTLQSTSGSGANIAGASINIAGGQGTGTGNGGDINFQIASPGSSGSSLNNLANVGIFSGTNGSFSLQNTINSDQAFTVKESGGLAVLRVDTVGQRVAIGQSTGTIPAKLYVNTGTEIAARIRNFSSTDTNNLLEIQKVNTNVVTIASTGAALFKPSANSANAFDIQDTASDSMLKVDTSNKFVIIGHETGTLNGANAALLFGDTCGNTNTCISLFEGEGINGSDTGDTDVLQIQGANGLRFSTGYGLTSRMVINSSGNIGIGTEDPTEMVTIQGGSLMLRSADGSKAYRFRTSGGSLDFESSGAGVPGELWMSGWTGAGFTGTQVNWFRMSAGDRTITVGTGVSTATPTLLVLDRKSSASGTADPAGFTGAMYYNESLDRFRCYQAGQWDDCVGSPTIDWTNVPIQSPAIDGGAGYSTHRVRRLATGQVELQLDVGISGGSGGSVIGTLPTWARPTGQARRYVPAAPSSGSVFNAHVDINTAGNLLLYGANFGSITWIALNVVYTP